MKKSKLDILTTYEDAKSNKLSGTDYYLISLKNEQKHSIVGVFSVWVGFVKENPKREFREIDLVDPEGVVKDFQLFEKDLLIVNNSEELTSFLSLGGYAIVDKDVTTTHLLELTEPIDCADLEDRGFVQYSTLPKINQARFARDGLRTKIIDRDNYQCRVCGSSPEDSVHIRLEVHHIKPWEEGGLTIPENLITLCATCHKGADEFNRWKLYEKIGIGTLFQNSTFFAPLSRYDNYQRRKSVFYASNCIEIKANKLKLIP